METICRSCVNYRNANVKFQFGVVEEQWCEENMEQFLYSEGCFMYKLRKEQEENVPPVVL